ERQDGDGRADAWRASCSGSTPRTILGIRGCMARRGIAVIFTFLGVAVFLSIAGFALLYLIFGREPPVSANSTLVLQVGGELNEVAPSDVVSYFRGVKAPTVRSVVDN